MFQSVRHWWTGGRGKVTARLFVFELVVVILGVLIAQGLAGWAEEQAESRRAELDDAGMIEGVADSLLAARIWRAAVPCLQAQYEGVVRKASEGSMLDARDLARPRYRTNPIDPMPADVEVRIRERFGPDHALALGNIVAASNRLQEVARQIQTARDRFALLNPALGEPSPGDAAKVREAGIAALALLRTVGVQVNAIEEGARELGVDPSSFNRPVDRCEQIWRNDRLWLEAGDK